MKITQELILAVLALALSTVAIFQAREANKLSRLVLPSINVFTVSSYPIKNDLPNGYVATVCRTELRIANTGGSGTSVIGVRPVGSFGKGGYLPDYGQRFVAFKMSEFLWINLGLPIPLPTNLEFHEATFVGPVPYQIAVTKKGQKSPIFDGPNPFVKNPEVASFSFNDLLRRLRGTSRLGSTITAQIVPEEAVAMIEPRGLPLYIAENSVQDFFIDFRYAMPKAFDLAEFSNQRRMARDGVDPRVGYQLSFPDIPPVDIPPVLCQGKVLDTK